MICCLLFLFVNLRDVVNYYKTCYRADSRDLNLWNLFKIKASDRFIFSGEDELANGFMPRVPVPTDIGEHLVKHFVVRVIIYSDFF